MEKKYYWRAFSDDGSFEDFSEQFFDNTKDAYKDMRDAVLEKMKWNTNLEDFEEGEDFEKFIGYNVAFYPMKITHQSYSGLYTYEIKEYEPKKLSFKVELDYNAILPCYIPNQEVSKGSLERLFANHFGSNNITNFSVSFETEKELKSAIKENGSYDGNGFILSLDAISFNGKEIILLGYYPDEDYEINTLQIGVTDENETFGFIPLETLKNRYPTIYKKVMEQIEKKVA